MRDEVGTVSSNNLSGIEPKLVVIQLRRHRAVYIRTCLHLYWRECQEWIKYCELDNDYL